MSLRGVTMKDQGKTELTQQHFISNGLPFKTLDVFTASIEKKTKASKKKLLSSVASLKKNNIEGNDMYSVGWNSAINTVIDIIKSQK